MIIPTKERFKFFRVCAKHNINMGDDYIVKHITPYNITIEFKYDTHETLANLLMESPEW